MIMRLFKWRRLRWFAAGTLVRFLLRRSAGRSVDRATAEFEERLPGPVRKALDIVPADAMRAGGSAVVAGRTARRVAVGSRRATRLVGEHGRRVTDGVSRVRSIGDEIGREADAKRRELKAQYLRATQGNAAADDAMLDLRSERSAELGEQPSTEWIDDEPPELLDPVRPGRWRAEKRLRPSTVSRVQRSYRPRSMPWDR